VAALEQQSKHKAKLVYDALEQHSDTFKILIEPQYRSRTNVVFRTVEGESGDKRFVSEAEKEGTEEIISLSDFSFLSCRCFLSLV